MKEDIEKETKIDNIVPNLEAIPLVTIYAHEDRIGIKYNQEDANKYEIYGFLKIYIKLLEGQLFDEQSEDVVT